MTGFGTRTTFQIFAVFTLFMGCLYYFFNRFYISKLPKGETNEICKKEPKKLQEVCLAVIDEKQLSNGIKVEPKVDSGLEEDVVANNNGKIQKSDVDTQESHENPAFQSDEAEKTENK